jgi:hypothetical protein
MTIPGRPTAAQQHSRGCRMDTKAEKEEKGQRKI